MKAFKPAGNDPPKGEIAEASVWHHRKSPDDDG